MICSWPKSRTRTRVILSVFRCLWTFTRHVLVGNFCFLQTSIYSNRYTPRRGFLIALDGVLLQSCRRGCYWRRVIKILKKRNKIYARVYQPDGRTWLTTTTASRSQPPRSVFLVSGLGVRLKRIRVMRVQRRRWSTRRSFLKRFAAARNMHLRVRAHFGCAMDRKDVTHVRARRV